MSDLNYYASQLRRLKDSKYYKTVVIRDSEGNATKYMSIHLESIPEIIAFLQKEERRLTILELIEERANDWQREADQERREENE